MGAEASYATKELFSDCIGIKSINDERLYDYYAKKIISEKVDYIIDDDTEICSNAADNNIYAVYFKNNAANRINKEKVINVNNWGEIYKYLILKRKGT